MSHGTLNQEIKIENVDVQNDAKTDTENLDQQNDTFRVCKIVKPENTRETQANPQINIELTQNDEDLKKHTQGRENLPMYWVQFNFAGGARIPDGGGTPLYYEPDRNLFVRLVFSIVLFMLILTAGFVMFVYMTDVREMFLRFGMIILIVGFIGMLGLNYAMMCSACTRMPPCNFICLFLAVCFMSMIAAYITARYRTQVVLLALLATIVTVIVCLILACTRFDFTQYLLYVIVIATAFAALVMIISITMFIMNVRYKPLTIVILIIGTLLNVVILIMELQMILGGRAVELSEDDYALGAFMLYTSIVDLFLKLVQLLGIFDS